MRWKRQRKKLYLTFKFSFFEYLIKDDSITEFEYIEYIPNDSSNVNKLGEQKIKTCDLDEYLLPLKAMVEDKGKLVKTADNSNNDVTDVVTVVNNGLSYFLSIQYKIDVYLVENVNQYLPQASTMLNLVQILDDYGKRRATNMLWFRDTAKGGAELNEFGVPGAPLLPSGTVADNTKLTGAQV